MKAFKFILIITLLLSFAGCIKRGIHVDILIKNGIVYNGTDTIGQKLSIGIKGDKIVFSGDEKDTLIYVKKTIDASGLIVCPGFIDPHTHADRDLNDPEKSHNKPFLMQGITTVVVGNDGNSFYPLRDYRTLYEQHGIGTNAVLLTGHGSIRKEVIGLSDKKATEADIVKMQALVQQEMDAGAFGLSTGLFYAPGSYGNTEEVIALAKIAAKNGGIYDTHLRDESAYNIGLIPAIEEAIEIGRHANIPVHISHIKCLGVDVWHQSEDIIKIIEKSRAEGINVTANQYPYDASATGLKAATVPRWAESGGKDSLFIRYDQRELKKQILEETKKNITRRGGSDKLLIIRSEDSTFLGKNLLEISEMLRLSPEETVFIILKTGKIGVASFNMIQEDIYNFMKQPWLVTGSDGNTGHPRKYGTFPRKYRKYVQEEKVINIAAFINNSTSTTAKIFNISNRGKLQEGYYADVIIFNPKTFKDKASYTDAFQFAEGLEYSIVNGQIVVEKGVFSGKLMGRVLTK